MRPPLSLGGVCLTALLVAAGFGKAVAAPYMIVGNDEKLTWDDQGKAVLSPTGKDTVLIVDLAEPESPKIVATLPLENSVVGPPVNVAIAPNGAVALVADSVTVVKEGDALKQVPTDKLFVIDLKANPPKLAQTLTVGKQPSGLDISPNGDLALVANRADNSVSVIKLDGTDAKVVGTVPMGDSVSHVTFTPDGKHALAVKSVANKVALLDIDGDTVTYGKLDLPTYIFPYNVQASPDGKIAITADNGNAGASDGSVDIVSVVDLEAKPPRIVDRVVVGDGPEGFAISPKGDVAIAAILRGSNADKKAYFYNRNGSVTVLRIAGKTVTPAGTIEVGGLPEAVVFTPDGRYAYIGNFLDQDFSILKIEGDKVADTGKRFKVPGHPASARMSPK